MFLVLFIFGDAHQRQDLLLRVDTATCMLAALISELDRLSREAQYLESVCQDCREHNILVPRARSLNQVGMLSMFQSVVASITAEGKMPLARIFYNQ